MRRQEPGGDPHDLPQAPHQGVGEPDRSPRPNAAKIATLPPSSAPRLAGTMKLKNFTAVPRAPMANAASGEMGRPRSRTTR